MHHVLGVEAVLPDGELVHLGGAVLDTPGLDLLGVLVGSEGTLAIVTKATVRLLRRPEKVTTLLAGFASIDAAGEAVSAIIADGIVPAAVEMMDRLTIDAAEAAVHPNFPKTDAVLIVELDGPESEVDELFAIVESLCRKCGAITMEVAKDQAQRERIWKGRKAAFAAMGRVSPNYYVQDGVVPRTKLPEVLRRIRALEERSGLRIGNVFHAGDGNLHPLICYDEAIPGQAEHAGTGRVGNPHVLHRSRRRRSRASTAWARTRKRYDGRRCSAPTISTPCSSCAAPSTPPASATPARSFRRRGCAAKSRARTGSIPLEQAGAGGAILDGTAAWSSRPMPPASRPKLKRANGERLAVTIRGAGTKQSWGAPAPRTDVVLSTLGLKAPVDHVAGDLVATAPAGASLDAVNDVLRRERQWLPLDPPRVGPRDHRRHRRDERQRSAAPSIRHAARSDHRHRDRAGGRTHRARPAAAS